MVTDFGHLVLTLSESEEEDEVVRKAKNKR